MRQKLFYLPFHTCISAISLVNVYSSNSLLFKYTYLKKKSILFPVALKMLGRSEEKKAATIDPPADPSIKTLFVGNVDGAMGEADLRDAFYSFGNSFHFFLNLTSIVFVNPLMTNMAPSFVIF